MPFHFTLFNNITLLLMALTAVMVIGRLKGRFGSSWALSYYVAAVAYAKVFGGSLKIWLVLAGVVCAVLLRFVALRGSLLLAVRILEIVVLSYVFLRGLGLLLFWRDFF